MLHWPCTFLQSGLGGQGIFCLALKYTNKWVANTTAILHADNRENLENASACWSDVTHTSN